MCTCIFKNQNEIHIIDKHVTCSMLYLQNEVTKINERKKETHKEKYGGILISGISLLQNSEVALL